MDKAIQQLSQIDWWSFLITVAIVICAYLAIREVLEKFCKKIGYTPQWVKYREEQAQAIEELKSQMEEYQNNRIHDRQQSFEIQKELVDAQKKLANSQKDLMDCFTTVSEKLDILQKNIDDNELHKQIEKYRDKIFNFASNLNSPHFNPEKDHYDNIFKVYQDYEKLLHDNHLTNGQCEASMNVIRKHYEKDLDDGLLHEFTEN